MTTIAKAIVGAATAAGAWLVTATAETAPGVGTEITSAEWGIGICGAVVAFFLVWAVPNRA